MDNNNNNGAAPHATKYQLEISVEQKLKQLDTLSDKCFIYRVPERLRCLKPNMYTPKVVSIGPLHHDKETLQDMEDHKYRYLDQFLDRSQESQQDLQFYMQQVRNQEAKLRRYYAESIKFDSDKFVSIILVDSAFIIELFLNFYFEFNDRAPAADRIVRAPKMISDIRPDLLLLENQVPFFILENLYDLNPEGNPDDEDRKLPFTKLFCYFFRGNLKDIGVDYDLQTVCSCQVEHKHFIDLVRNLCLPSEPLVRVRRNFTAPSITELHQAGVKLRKSETRNLFSIQFINGVLEIPKLEIYDRLEHTLRNLVSFEQCHYDNGIADYLDLMDCLVNTPKDVELLVKHDIVRHGLGENSEVCSLINGLCKEININYDLFCFAALYEDLYKHCQRPWNRWKASLRQNYFYSPWAIASVSAASLLIILTIAQTAFSVISFF